MIKSALKEPVLIYDRIDSNKQYSFLVLFLFSILTIPYTLYLIEYAAFVVGLNIVLAFPEANFLADSEYVEKTFVISGEQYQIHYPANIFLLLTMGAVVVFLTGLATYFYSARLALRMTKARFLQQDEETELQRIVDNLCIGSGLPKPQLAIIDSDAANIFSTGMSPEKAYLVVTSGLLGLLDYRELESVVAYELSQIGNYDIRLKTIVSGVVRLIWLPYLLVAALFRLAMKLPYNGCFILMLLWFVFPIILGMLYTFMLIISPELILPEFTEQAQTFIRFEAFLLLYVSVLMPLIGVMILLGVSRKRVFLADADSALLTRYSPALAMAFAKMEAAGNARMDVSLTNTHLYIIDPRTKGEQEGRLLSCHPMTKERIDILFGMGGLTPEMLDNARKQGQQFHDAK